MKAFPFTYELSEMQGMDLRDYFAAKAMQAIIGNDEIVKSHIEIAKGLGNEPIDVLCKESYEIADAMMKAREL